jgi:hypothetical protein
MFVGETCDVAFCSGLGWREALFICASTDSILMLTVQHLYSLCQPSCHQELDCADRSPKLSNNTGFVG